MQLIKPARRLAAGAALAVTVAAATAGSASQASALTSGHRGQQPAARVSYSVGPISDVSAGCPGTGDISEAVDHTRHYVYQEFEGCNHDDGIGFARSANGGDSYATPVALPDSRGAWDPWLAVAPDGTLYAGFMNTIGNSTYPIIDVSDNHGRTFQAEQSLKPAKGGNWGDADYITVGSNGTLFVAWDYGPSNSEVKLKCSRTGSCFATRGDLNVVVQSSTDEAKTFTPMSVVNPGFPDAGADMGQVIVAPGGAIDVLYQNYAVLNRKTLKLGSGVEDFTTSTDGGKTWSAPVVVGASAGRETIDEWWNDVSLATDPAGDLYATWDTQGKAGGHKAQRHKADTGWVSFSTDGGKEWSAPVQATPDQDKVPHIMEVAGAVPGEAYVAWVSPSDPRGYALYLRTFSVSADGGAGGWLSGAVRISQKFGNPADAPGDTFGIAAITPTALALSWGGAVPGAGGSTSVFAAPVSVRTG